MKKSATKASGVLTLILYVILLVFAVFSVASVFEVTALTDVLSSNETLGTVVSIVSGIFVDIPVSLLSGVAPIEADMLNTIFSCLFAAFCLLMIFWGIKEITLAKKDDVSFANCKKTCGFMMFTKFMAFLFVVAMAVCAFIVEDVKTFADTVSEDMGVPFIYVIVCAVFAILGFIIFILPTTNFSKAAKAVANGNYTDSNANYDPNAQYNGDPNGGYYDPNAGQYAPQPTMQANMPPMPGYQPQYNMPQQQSIQAQFNPEVQAAEIARANQIIPGENGVPANITQKGIEDLERLERLRSSGAITEENYVAMKNKIFTTNIS